MNLNTRTSAQSYHSSQAVTKPLKEKPSFKDYFTIDCGVAGGVIKQLKHKDAQHLPVLMSGVARDWSQSFWSANMKQLRYVHTNI